jgi:type I restriction enzyme, S subunit
MRCETRITEIVDFNPSRTLKRNALAPFVDMAALPEGQRDIASLSEREFTGGGSRFWNGDTLFARITPCLENGKTAKVNVLPAGFTAHGSTEFIVMAAKAPEFDEDFVYYLARHPDFRKFAEARMEGTSGRQRVSWQSLSEYTFPFPPSIERKKIGYVLRTLDDKIALNRRINQTLEAMAQAIFKSWFVDFDPVKAKIAAKAEGRDPLRAAMTAISGKPDAELDTLPPDQFTPLAATAALFPDELENSGLGEIPKGWHSSTLGEQSAYLNRGISPKYIDEGGVLVLNQKCVRDFSLDPSKGRRHDPTQRNVSGRELLLGDVLVNSTGVGTLGRVAQVLHLDEPTIVDSHVTVVRTGHNLNSAYLGQWFVMKQPDIEAMGEGSTGQTELSRGKLATMPILVPDLAVLGAFATAIAPMQSLIAARNRESLVLQQTRDALLPRLLSGELHPAVALEGAEA